jgi:GntR family transcriptional regulator
LARDGRELVSGRRDSLSIAVADELRRGIAEGRYASGTRLPSEPDLAEQTGVSRATLREALKLLEREGLVVRRQRTGTTVSARPIVHNSLERNYGVREMIEASGKEHAIRDAHIHFAEAPSSIAEALRVPVGSPVTILERVRTADGRPVILTIDHLDSHVVERATAPLLPDVSFYEWLRNHCGLGVTHGVAQVSAIPASAELAERLEVLREAPIFSLTQIDYTAAGAPVLHSQEFHAADAFEITVVRTGPYPQ